MTDGKEALAETAVEVRERIVQALELDLVGPWPGHELARERLRGWERPSNWYLTGFLVPVDAPPEQSGDAEADDDLDEVPEREGPAEESANERVAAKRSFFPSSMGLSTLVGADASGLTATVRWGDYATAELPADEESGRTATPVWERTPREQSVAIALGAAEPEPVSVPDSGGLELHVLERPLPDAALGGRLPAGTRSVSVFLVNRRVPDAALPDSTYIFQPELEISCPQPFVGRPDLRGAQADELDDRLADLHYADTPEYATGHGVSADWTVAEGECHALRTRWLPQATVEVTQTAQIEGVELAMDTLGELADGGAVHAALDPLVAEYRGWIEQQSAALEGLDGARRETAELLLHQAGRAAKRIEQGIGSLAGDEDARDAFGVANRAVAAALKRRLRVDNPVWRPFQLAFILLNLPGIADSGDPNRETVDLLFFPTGGGKTEAYLGLSAFAMVLRRLRHPGAEGRAAAGVCVMMRYTLRLLTLDQLGRAAGLVCALELERERAPERYGEWPFEIGLWVGRAATPNRLGHKGDKRSDTARTKVRQFQNDPKYRPSPVPLEECPWCGEPFTPDSFSLLPDADRPRELRIVCGSLDCDFNGDRALPIVAVDEPLYRRLPAFLIATVDKFATLPWIGESGALLGGATRADQHGFYGPAEPGAGKPLPAPLAPPDLVIQDELHLIAGPLGTMAGLYETAIEGLCAQGGTRPKIVASTATVRRAQDQIQALFARPSTAIFPPPGSDRRDSFFARVVPATEAPGRLYVGVGAQGRNPKVVMRKVWLALMGAAEKAYRDHGGHENPVNPADPYMTVLGYFNSLRELGGARRILEEEVRNTLRSYGERRRVDDPHPLFRDRRSFSDVVELTSRVPTNQVAEARRRLDARFDSKERIDCAIATNMISVGLDIGRLGLMGVLGQPKTAAEYIQATSRVGRTAQAPGLVVTLLNVHKPRDRSHYERFRHFHDTFYRSVEVGSVTPFSARALDRGFAGALVALARHLLPALTPARGPEQIAAARAELEQRARALFGARVDQQAFEDSAERDEVRAGVHARVGDLLDSWRKLADDHAEEGVQLQYQPHELSQPRPLLRDLLDDSAASAHAAKFRVNRSLRDVEPSVNLFMRDP